MNLSQLRSRCKPHLWFQLYWVIYLIWFFWLDLTIQNPKYIIHSPLDDMIPFNEWFVFPYCSWFLLLAGVTALLWWYDTASYDKLCLSMFAGMTFCLIVYMVLPNGLDIRPTAEAVGRSNIAMRIMQLLWSADASVTEVLEHLTVFIRNCDLHTKNSFLCTRFSLPILTDCAEIGKGTRAFCAFWSGKHSRYVKMISETAAKCIIIEPEKRVQV